MSYQITLHVFTKQIKEQHVEAVHGFNSSRLTYLPVISPLLKKLVQQPARSHTASDKHWCIQVCTGMICQRRTQCALVHFFFPPSQHPRLIFLCKVPHLLLFHCYLTPSAAPLSRVAGQPFNITSRIENHF